MSEFEGNSLERGVCPGPNLVRVANAASHRRFRLDRAHVPLQ